jgi:signal transduction histidine kinase
VAEIVRGLRNFSRSDTDLKVPDNLHDILNNALLILSSKYKDRIEIQRLYDERIGPIECYSGQLSQVFLNIIANAVDAIDGKGTVSIETQDLGEKVRIAIQDTGPGIPQEIQAKIFDPFFTTKDVGKGTGLGLSIVHGIVEKHGGRIWVESEMGKGSIFFIEVPK